MRLLLKLRGQLKRRRRSLSLLRPLNLPKKPLFVFPQLMLFLGSKSSRLNLFNSKLMSTKLLFKPFRVYLLSNSESKEIKSKRRLKSNLSRN